ALKERFHAEVALGHFDDALVTAKTIFAMSRHMGEHPTLIGDLVGIAVAYHAVGPLDEMLVQPCRPHLYCALSYLPSPFIPLDKGSEAERQFLVSEFLALDGSTPLSSDQLSQLIAHMDKVRELDNAPGKKGQPSRAGLNARTKVGALLSAARRRLVEY